MNADISIINRNSIPDNIYLRENADDEWNMIHLCTFDNGLQCILGANISQTPKNIIDRTKYEMDSVLQNCISPEELQNYFYENFQDFKTYKDCVKIFNYYTNNRHLIDDAFYSYFDLEDGDDEVIVNGLEEGYSSN